jgi:hypothetical protein
MSMIVYNKVYSVIDKFNKIIILEIIENVNKNFTKRSKYLYE